MTETQAKTHGKVIRWWTRNTDKGVWWRDGDVDWMLCECPTFKMLHYVQNDEYAELRKAHVDGKKIESKVMSWSDSSACGDLDGEWHSRFDPFKERFVFSAEYYRIKPIASFELGDWFVNKQNDKLFQINQNDIEFHESTLCQAHPWKPTKGEWCMFWDDNHVDRCYIVAKYDKYKDSYYHPLGMPHSCYQHVLPRQAITTLKDK